MTTTGDLGIRGVDEVEPLDVEGSAIFRGRQRTHNRQVAIKILDPLQEPLVPRRFDIRRKALNRFAEMPGVVSVYEVGVAPDGNQYLMMPYFRIGSLADQMAHGPTPWHRAAELIKKTAEIVGRGHELGVVLADLKPSRILLADASSPLVAVYGMATRRFDDGAPSYAAPETLRGATPTPSADVYSLSLTLAALIAGRAPNRGWPSREFMAEVEALAPPRIVEVIEHGLSENQANRFGSCVHLTTALNAALAGEPMVDVPGTAGSDPEPLDWESLLARVPPTGAPGVGLDEVLEDPHWLNSTTGNGRSDVVELAREQAELAENGWAGPGVRGPGDEMGPGPGDSGADIELRPDRRRWSAPNPSGTPRPPGPPGSLHDHHTPAEPVVTDTRADTTEAWAAPRSTDEALPGAATAHVAPRPRLLLTSETTATGDPEAAPVGMIWNEVEIQDLESETGQPPPGPLSDTPIPFRAFERQQLPALPSNPVLRFIETVQGAWFNRRRSYGGFLALLSFALIATMAGWLVVRDFRAPVAPISSDSSFTTFIDSSDAGGSEPTSQIPMLIEPPSTNSTTTIRSAQQPRSMATTARRAPAPAGPAASPSTAPPTTSPPGTSPPTTSDPTTAPPTSTPATTTDTAAPTTAADSPPGRPRRTTTTTEPPETAPPDAEPEGLTMPLIERAEVTRVRATSARIGVTSPSCVTAVFTYTPVGGSTDQVASSTCSTAHTLLLGTVTPALRTGTAYTVTVSVTDPEGRGTTQTLAFTTLG